MTRNNRWSNLTYSLVIAACGSALALPPAAFAARPTSNNDKNDVAAQEVELFHAMRDGTVNAQIVVRNDHAARVILTNNTQQPLNIQLPEAFAAVPALAQFGGGGGGGRGGGGQGGGGGQQSSGGGLGGGQGGGGGGGVFSIPPDATRRIDVAVLCLDHGLRDPSSSKPYNLVPAEEHIDRPEVIALLTAFGNGQLQHGAAQAAVWHLNNDLDWSFLAAKLDGTRRSVNRSPYFSADEIRTGMNYAVQARAYAQDVGRHQRPQPPTTSAEVESADASEAKSTEDDAASDSASDSASDETNGTADAEMDASETDAEIETE